VLFVLVGEVKGEGVSLEIGSSGSVSVARKCNKKDTDVHNNKTRIKWRLGKCWVPSDLMEVLRTRTYTSFLSLKNKRLKD
jgi:hypothetical protein